MNLYLISQTVNDHYNTFDSAVVAAPDEESARNTHPDDTGWEYPWEAWAPQEHVAVRLIGVAASDVKQGVVCSSYNAA